MVCFEVDIDHEIIDSEIPCKWSSKYSSVVGCGKASFITDSTQKKDALNIIIDHYSPGTSYNFPEKNLHEAAIIKIEITQINGKKSR
jgi:nitroimidazol reductase NimA-like FMN-containing flavoprotein (pyridoxamine 5'-phosphate oxidase superfamily)